MPRLLVCLALAALNQHVTFVVGWEAKMFIVCEALIAPFGSNGM